MAYKMETISPTTATIKLGRNKIGHAVQKHDNSGLWFGSMQVDGRRYEYTGSKANMLRGLVEQANRVALCGHNNHAAAAAALEELNKQTAASNARAWADTALIRETLTEIGAAYGIQVPTTPPRPRFRKISI